MIMLNLLHVNSRVIKRCKLKLMRLGFWCSSYYNVKLLVLIVHVAINFPIICSPFHET